MSQDDIETVRGTLNYLDQFRTLEPQHEDRDEALNALERIVARLHAAEEERDAAGMALVKLQREVLASIAALTSSTGVEGQG